MSNMICLTCGSTDFHICSGEECIWEQDVQDEVVICPKCRNIQEEGPRRKGDKYAWECHRCYSIVENGKLHPFETMSGYVKTRGGVCCYRGNPVFIPEKDLNYRHFEERG